MPFYDAHNHLQFAELAPHLDRIAADLAALDFGAAVVNGTHPLDDWPAVAALAARFPWVRPSYGLHPWDVGTRPPDWREHFVTRLTAEPRAAVGEIGLDAYILEPARATDPSFADVVAAPLAAQLEVFTFQLHWAAAHDRPATVHCLRAWEPLRAALRTTPVPARGWLLHAYGGPPELVPEFAAAGAYFSFNTSHLDPRKTRQRDAFRRVPLDRLLVETDAPAMSPPAPSHQLPDPTLNHPANLALAYAGLADLRGLPLADLTAQVADNFHRLFAISSPPA
jgi:TatD DNase family protein